jgi:hypothetical protein
MNAMSRRTVLGIALLLCSSQSMAAVAVNMQILNRNSGKALDEDVTIEGLVQQWKNYHSVNQTWTIVYFGDGTSEIRNVATGRCLDIQAANILDPTANGHYAHTWDCTGAANQRFRIEPYYIYNPGGISGSDGVRIRAVHSNKCLDVTDYSRANGGGLQQWDCHDGLNQRFDILP